MLALHECSLLRPPEVPLVFQLCMTPADACLMVCRLCKGQPQLGSRRTSDMPDVGLGSHSPAILTAGERPFTALLTDLSHADCARYGCGLEAHRTGSIPDHGLGSHIPGIQLGGLCAYWAGHLRRL